MNVQDLMVGETVRVTLENGDIATGVILAIKLNGDVDVRLSASKVLFTNGAKLMQVPLTRALLRRNGWNKDYGGDEYIGSELDKIRDENGEDYDEEQDEEETFYNGNFQLIRIDRERGFLLSKGVKLRHCFVFADIATVKYVHELQFLYRTLGFYGKFEL